MILLVINPIIVPFKGKKQAESLYKYAKIFAKFLFNAKKKHIV